MTETTTTRVVMGQPVTTVTTRVTTVLDLSSVREWQATTCGCFDDLKGCLYVCCCPCLAGCDIAHTMDEYTWILCCCENWAQMRSKVRYLGRIHGSQCGDNCCMMCLGPCVMCQMHSELKMMGVMKDRGIAGELFQCPGDPVCRC